MCGETQTDALVRVRRALLGLQWALAESAVVRPHHLDELGAAEALLAEEIGRREGADRLLRLERQAHALRVEVQDALGPAAAAAWDRALEALRRAVEDRAGHVDVAPIQGPAPATDRALPTPRRRPGPAKRPPRAPAAAAPQVPG